MGRCMTFKIESQFLIYAVNVFSRSKANIKLTEFFKGFGETPVRRSFTTPFSIPQLLPFRMSNYCLHCGGLQVHNHYSMNNISFSRATLSDHIHKRAFYHSRFADKLTRPYLLCSSLSYLDGSRSSRK